MKLKFNILNSIFEIHHDLSYALNAFCIYVLSSKSICLMSSETAPGIL